LLLTFYQGVHTPFPDSRNKWRIFGRVLERTEEPLVIPNTRLGQATLAAERHGVRLVRANSLGELCQTGLGVGHRQPTLNIGSGVKL